jgi:hypothetical protein
MWKECQQMAEAAGPDNRVAAVMAVIELNRRAIDECNEALNTLDFVRRLDSEKLPTVPKVSARSTPAEHH